MGLSFNVELEARDGGGLFLSLRVLRREEGSGSEGCGLEEPSARETFGHI